MAARRTIPALAVVSLLGGCGDELADFRKDELRPLEQRADEQKARLAATLKVVQMRDRADARALESQVTELEKTFTELAGLEPPDDYEDEYADFVAANTDLIKQLRTFTAALRRGDSPAMKAATERAKTAIGDSQNAIQPLHE